jgi:membrane protease YdiL (CAAX protease family)
VLKSPTTRTIAAAVASMVAGIAVWVFMYLYTGKTDPTGDDIYWRGGYPAFVLLSALFGFFLGYRGWIFACGMLATQLIIVLIFSPRDNPQLPIGLMLYVLFAVPLAIAAFFGGFIARRLHKR